MTKRKFRAAKKLRMERAALYRGRKRGFHLRLNGPWARDRAIGTQEIVSDDSITT